MMTNRKRVARWSDSADTTDLMLLPLPLLVPEIRTFELQTELAIERLASCPGPDELLYNAAIGLARQGWGSLETERLIVEIGASIPLEIIQLIPDRRSARLHDVNIGIK